MDPRVRRVLAVADWSIDPEVVAEALAAHDRREAAVFGLLVPARLAPLDWVGDPKAACPCASEQLERLRRRAQLQGAKVDAALVGDPEPVPAVDDALAAWPAEEIVVFERERRLSVSHPLSVARRLGRRTGLAVERVLVPAAGSSDHSRGLLRRRASRCAAAVA